MPTDKNKIRNTNSTQNSTLSICLNLFLKLNDKKAIKQLGSKKNINKVIHSFSCSGNVKFLWDEERILDKDVKAFTMYYKQQPTFLDLHQEKNFLLSDPMGQDIANINSIKIQSDIFDGCGKTQPQMLRVEGLNGVNETGFFFLPDQEFSQKITSAKA